jgi:uncharacterized membrane protein
MLELLSLALFVVAVVAINKANGAIKENAALRAELERIRLHLEGEPAFKEDDSRHHPAADAGEVSNLAGNPQTSTAGIVRQPVPDVGSDDISAAAVSQAAARAANRVPDVRPAVDVPTLETESSAHQPEPAINIQPEVTPEASVQEPVAEPVATSFADAGGGIPAEPTATGGSGDRERTIATQWTVWIGGIALAMGGLLIVKFSIEAGFFGPGVRLIMGAAFALALAAASEIIRRHELRLNVGKTFTDQIPAVLAGVSVLSAFGVAYAAHAVYGMIGPGPAFAAMGAIGLSVLAASLLHGPRFGLFGLVGSYVSPIMISGVEPYYVALSIFVAIVTTVACLLHMRRPSTALLGGAVVGHTIWTWLIALGPNTSGWGTFLLMVAIVLATLVVESAERSPERRETELGKYDLLTALAAFALPLVFAGFLWVEIGGGLASRLTLIVLVAGNILAAIRHRGLAPLAPLAGSAAVGFILLWPDVDGPLRITPQLIFDLVRLDLVPRSSPGLAFFATLFGALVSAPLLASLFAPWRNGAGDTISRGCIAFAAALAPVCMMLAASLRLNGFNRTTGFAIIAATLALACATISELLYRRERERTQDATDPLSFVGSAAFAAAGAIAVGLAIAFALRETWLVVGFAVASAGVALVARRRPIPLLRTITGSLATAALARVIWQPTLTDLGDWPVLNWLVVVYGLPALAFGVAAWALSARRDRARSVVEGLAALFLTAVVALELIQAFVGGNLWDVELLFRFGDDVNAAASQANRATALVALLTIAAAFLASLFMALKRRTQRPVFAAAEKILAVAATSLAIAGLGVFLNPVFNGVPILDPAILNRLLFAYVGLALVLALLANALPRQAHDNLLQITLEFLAIVIGVLGAVLVLRHCFTGPDMSIRAVTSVSFYESVATTLLLLVSTALVGLWRNRRESELLGKGLVGVALVAAGYAAVMLDVIKNPIFDHSLVEGPILFNRLLWGYAPVAVGFVALARFASPSKGALYHMLLLTGGVTASLMIFLLIRHGFHGPALFSNLPITLAEAGLYGSLALIAEFLRSRAQLRLTGAPPDQSAQVFAVLAIALHVIVLLVAVVSGARLVGWTVLNNSLPALLMPAAVAAMMALWCRSAGFDPPLSRLYAVAASVGGGIYALLQMRFAFHGATLVSDEIITLAEAGTYGCLALIAAFFMSRKLNAERTARGNDAPLALCAIMAVGTPACLLGVAALSGTTLEGWVLLNNSILGLLAPTILAATISLWSRDAIPALMVSRIYGAGAVLGGLVYCLVQIRVAVPGAQGLGDFFSTNHETRLYGYSLTIIAYGTALLIAGFRMAYRDLRIAALAVVGLAVLKVFLLDLRDLEGLWRATSFIGLGISLIGIAYLYRWLEPEGETKPEG